MMNYEEFQEIQRLERIDYQKAVALSIQNITENQHCWIRAVLNNEDDSEFPTVAPSYLYRLKTHNERNLNKNLVKDELDMIRKESKSFLLLTPGFV